MRRLLALLDGPRDGSLGGRAVNTAFWRLFGHGGGVVLKLGGNLVMARLLAPEAFGLMAFVFTLHAGLVMMTDLGVRVSVMRSESGDDPDFLRTAWTIQALQFGLLSLALLVVAAGFLIVQTRTSLDLGATVYAAPELPGLIAVSALALTAQGLQSMSQAFAERRLALGRWVLIDLAALVASTTSMIGLAAAGAGVWSLVWGAVIGGVLRTAASHLLLPGPAMKFLWRPDHACEIWRFGRWLIGASAFGFVANQGDKFLLGALLDADSFGLYTIGSTWVLAAREGISRVLEPTALAVFGETRRSGRAPLGDIFERYRAILDAICLAAFLAALLFGPAFVSAIYPDDYRAAGAVIALLSYQLLLQRYSAFTALLLHVGDSRSVAATTAAVAFGMVVAPAAAWLVAGPYAAILAVGLNGLWATPIQIARSGAHVALDRRREFLIVAMIAALALATAPFDHLAEGFGAG